MAKKEKRNYNIPDHVMLRRAQKQKDALAKALAAFTERFPWLDAAYLAGCQTAIDLAAGITKNYASETDTKVYTAAVKTCMRESKACLDELFRYSALAYPSDKKRQEALGKNRLEKARSNTIKMMSLLHQAWSLAGTDPYKTSLLNKGYTQEQTDALLVTWGMLKTKNARQQDVTINGTVITNYRIKLYNIVFDRMRLFTTCAGVVYLGNAARLKQFSIYPPLKNPKNK